MRVVVWSALGRVGNFATGVGKHILRMTCGLRDLPGFDVRLLMTSDIARADMARGKGSLMDAIPSVRLPFSRVFGEMCWRTLGAPNLDRWLDGADWVYCPRELYAPVRGSRFAVTVHDLYAFEPEFEGLRPRTWRGSPPIKKALSRAELVLTVSSFTRSRLIELLNVPEEKIRVVGNGVDEGFFAVSKVDPAEASPFPGNAYVLSVGGLTHKKGASAILATARMLLHVLPHVLLVVTGPVDPRYAEEAGKLPNLMLVSRGFPDEQMQRLVRGAAVVLILSEYEGFGMPALEAMAAGVPVVAARRASLPEVVGDAGEIVEPSDELEVVGAINGLLMDSHRREMRVRDGKQRAGAFRWPRCVDALHSALLEKW